MTYINITTKRTVKEKDLPEKVKLFLIYKKRQVLKNKKSF